MSHLALRLLTLIKDDGTMETIEDPRHGNYRFSYEYNR